MKEMRVLSVLIEELQHGRNIISLETIESYFGQGSLKDRSFKSELKDGICILKKGGYIKEVVPNVYRFNGDYATAFELVKQLQTKNVDYPKYQEKEIVWSTLKSVDKFKYVSNWNDDDDDDDDDDFF